MTLAKLAAVKAVKRDMRAKRLKLAHVERRVIVFAANIYVHEHPELIEETAETVRKVPQLRTLAGRGKRRRR